MPDSVAILLGAIFVNNFVTVQFLGLCPFLGTSRNFEGALGMGAPPRFARHPARRSLRFRCAGRRVPRARGARLRARLLSLSRGAARVALLLLERELCDDRGSNTGALRVPFHLALLN